MVCAHVPRFAIISRMIVIAARDMILA